MKKDQDIIPKQSFAKTEGGFVARPLEDMEPLLPRDIFMKNMIVEPLPVSYNME